MEQKVILLVEDDFLNRRLSKKALTENNYKVLEAKNAHEALEILKKEIVDLAILDINLGENEQDGISLGQHISNKLSVPFIYLTAYDNPQVRGKAVATTPYSYLTKPFKNLDLITSVEIAFKQSGKKHIPKILVKDGEYNVELSTDEINYIESNGNYLLFYTDKKIYKQRSTVKQVLEELSDSNFVQVHRAYIVNKAKIEKFNQKSLVVRNTEIFISKNYLGSLLP
ncbi:MAG: response regulator transcription factor [Sphingobacteriales bacterium]|jgi:DNA-binding LytR/AlgR family response regulator|nr:response regulator transcription factor [Sphingobacteriales bacterium]MBP9142421.1 response regulator transcription factor [Chitinophagales bacterium]MDA0199476.1 response regulator transcription factor [Bacteroidota bacterium]MBK6890673.1 response regulator transcription factor [Sphingobacteriales bacterium]MBK7526275.1 response regulator transcription factor [Sphingobacteriales bacterium]